MDAQAKKSLCSDESVYRLESIARLVCTTSGFYSAGAEPKTLHCQSDNENRKIMCSLTNFG